MLILISLYLCTTKQLDLWIQRCNCFMMHSFISQSITVYCLNGSSNSNKLHGEKTWSGTAPFWSLLKLHGSFLGGQNVFLLLYRNFSYLCSNPSSICQFIKKDCTAGAGGEGGCQKFLVANKIEKTNYNKKVHSFIYLSFYYFCLSWPLNRSCWSSTAMQPHQTSGRSWEELLCL